MRPDDVGLGGFDSHTLPPAGLALRCAALAMFAASSALAQKPDTAGVKAPVADTATAARAAQHPRKVYPAPPISPRRAFVYSALIPGMGQTALDRKYTGAVFFLIEGMSWALLKRSADDLRIAKAFVGDSVPQTYVTDQTTGIVTRDARGNPVVATWDKTRYSPELVHARTLHVEDWVAVILFNHLFAGADAFVAANLWDLPQHIGMRAAPQPGGGAAVNFTLTFR